MLEPAINRAPVEIWSNILALLIRSPLIPHPDATFAQLMTLFSTGCESNRLTRDLAQTTGRLRRVCRFWDSIIQQIQPRIVYCNFESRYEAVAPNHVVSYPSENNEAIEERTRHELLNAQRIEAWMPSQCFCGQQCRYSLPFKVAEQLQEEDIDGSPSYSIGPQRSFIPSQDLAQLEILIPRSFKGGENTTTLFARLPNLKALDWASERLDPFLSATIQHSIYQKLTHLKIRILWYDVYNIKDTVNFQCLQFLDLNLDETFGPPAVKEQDQLDLGSWATFPVLRSLHLWVTLTERKQDEFISFLKQIGPKLAGLIIEFPEEFRSWFAAKLWAIFPSLAEFGYKYYLPTADHSPPPVTIGPINLLYQLDDYSLGALTISSDPGLDDFIQTCQAWRITRMTMLETWNEAETRISNSVSRVNELYLPKRLEFYERLSALGVTICDRDGIRVTDPPGARFMEALKHYRDRMIVDISYAWLSAIISTDDLPAVSFGSSPT